MKLFSIALISLFLMSLASAGIGRIYPTTLSEGENMVSVTLTDLDEKDLTVSVIGPDIYDRVSGIRVKDTARVYMVIDIPHGVSGYYPVLVKLQNEDIRQVKKAWVYVE
ncbi:MAG: hypothetical protein HGA85_06235 [Nanoarchaeota archaeon]|nr:hypothetical protein [Nanoarchaeota archaeon]